VSATTQRIPLAEAEQIAAELVELLRPACVRIEVAGSIRRKRPDVGDLDIVAVPYIQRRMGGLFEDVPDDEDQLAIECDTLMLRGDLVPRLNVAGKRAWGPSLKRATYRGLAVDIQAVHDAETFGAWMAIRTGPAEFTKRLVTPRIQGGLLPPGFRFEGGFRLTYAGGAVPTPEEWMLFEALEMPWIEPEDRR
jgi:DNA polymerase/3'-5' exonuclease PolX